MTLNYWYIAALGLMLTLAPCVHGVMHGSIIRRLVALQLGGNIATLILVVLAESFSRSSYMDVALTAAFLSSMGVFVFIRLFERWF